MIWWLIGALVVGLAWLMVWALCRMAARGDTEEAQRNLVDLLAEQADARERADARALADNLDL